MYTSRNILQFNVVFLHRKVLIKQFFISVEHVTALSRKAPLKCSFYIFLYTQTVLNINTNFKQNKKLIITEWLFMNCNYTLIQKLTKYLI